jgi:CubicO group peptidase (beta-lactamase class C family)
MFNFQRTASLILCLLLLWQTTAYAQTSTPEPLKNIDSYIETAMKDWQIPGLAIAVVKDDKIVYAKGFGVREIGKSETVNEQTIFPIASATKAFTAAALGILADEGKLKIDDKVTKYLPEFQLYDPFVTKEITVRDLLAHKTSLADANILRFGGYDREEILRRIRFQKPAGSFRSQFNYNNQMYLAAGQIIPALTQKSWDLFLKERIFSPLGMTSTNTTVKGLENNPNAARPHAKVGGKVQSIPYLNVDNSAPSGAINSNVTDMAQWLRLQLGKGSFNGKQILNPATVGEMHSPQMVVPYRALENKISGEPQFLTYGLGWYVQDYRGKKVVQHAGRNAGMTAQVGFMPEENLGVVILTNMDSVPVRAALMFRVFDAFLGGESKDRSAELLAIFKAGEQQQEMLQKQIDVKLAQAPKPSVDLSEYTGTYEEQMLGQVRIVQENGKLVLRYSSELSGDLAHLGNNNFIAAWRNTESVFGPAQVIFTVNTDGKVEEMKLMGFTLKRANQQVKAEVNAPPTVSQTGKWNLTANAGGQTIPITLELKQDGTTLNGSLSSPMGGGAVKNAQVAGNLFTGTASVDFQGQQMEIALKGTINGDKMTGTISGPGLPPISFTALKGK